MKVVVSSPGRAHVLRLAGQLYKHDCLYYLFTQDFKRRTDNLPKSKIRGRFKLKMLRFIEMASLFLAFLGNTIKKLKECTFQKYFLIPLLSSSLTL
ncbi:MAG: hypothetical protein ACOCQG_04735 [Candidatus Nanoarchaeia archaeon]